MFAKSLIFAAAGIFSSGVLGGCSMQGGAARDSDRSSTGVPQFSTKGAERLVRPALATELKQGFTPKSLNQIAIYPMEQSPTAVPRVSSEHLSEINAKFQEKFQAGTSIQLVNVDQPKAVTKAIQAQRGEALAYSDRALRFGRELNSQGVLYGLISRYTEGDDSKDVATDRSAVSFRLWLADVKTGETLWSASFDDTNQPLSENILRLGQAAREGFRFLSAPQLIERGFSSAATELERVRKGSTL